MAEERLDAALAGVRNALDPDEELQARLDEVLQTSPDWVRKTILGGVNHDLQRSYEDVAGQMRRFKSSLKSFLAMQSTEESSELRQALRRLRDSDLRSLEKESRAIDNDAHEMVRAIETRDFVSLKGFAKSVERKALRFTDKFNAIEPVLKELITQCHALEDRFRNSKQGSLRLMRESEARRNWWFLLLQSLGLACGIMAAVTLVVSARACRSVRGSVSSINEQVWSAEAATSELMAQIGAISNQTAALTRPGLSVTTASMAAGAGLIASVAAGASTTTAGVGGAAAVLGSKALGSWALHLGLIGAPASHVGSTLGIGALAGGAAVGAVIASATSSKALAASALRGQAATLTSQATTLTAQATSLTAQANAAGATRAFFEAIAIGSGIIVALLVLVCFKRELIKRLLGKLWEEEIQQHFKAAQGYLAMEHYIHAAAEQLPATDECSERLLEAVDSVRETATDMIERAEGSDDVMSSRSGSVCASTRLSVCSNRSYQHHAFPGLTG